MVPRYFAFLAIGRLLIWFAKTSGPLDPLRKLNSFTKELFKCDFCLGVWVFALLGFYYQDKPFLGWFKSRLVEVSIVSVISSFLTWIFCQGWEIKFGVTVYD